VRALALTSTVLLFAAGCQSGDDMPSWPPFELTVPDDVPDQMTVTDKGGTEHPSNGKELWASGYRARWKRCVFEYDHGDVSLAGDRPEIPLLGDYVIVVRGWDAGCLACWRAIRADRAAP
jgi:hypothetical protein